MPFRKGLCGTKNGCKNFGAKEYLLLAKERITNWKLQDQKTALGTMGAKEHMKRTKEPV